MRLRFAKMHGLGNDFMVIHDLPAPTTMQIRAWADRHTGIGFDQLLRLSASQTSGVDFDYQIFNADGSEVEQCGNGVRCLAHYVYEQALSDKSTLTFANPKGQVLVKQADENQYTVDMGQPIFTPSHIPFEAASEAIQYTLDLVTEPLSQACERIPMSVLSMGNPHCVLIVEDIHQIPIERLAPAISTHPRFPDSVNVGFMQILNTQHIALRVYERGAKETLACGSGACAAVVAGRRLKQLDETVQVQLPGGTLRITWQGEGTSVQMTGPATTVFYGEVFNA